MNRRTNSRVVFPTAAILDMLIEKDASEIYALTIHPQVWLTAGVLQIYDGFDAGGKRSKQALQLHSSNSL